MLLLASVSHIGAREMRRILAEYVLTEEDIVPYRCLLPQGVEGILVAGRASRVTTRPTATHGTTGLHGDTPGGRLGGHVGRACRDSATRGYIAEPQAALRVDGQRVRHEVLIAADSADGVKARQRRGPTPGGCPQSKDRAHPLSGYPGCLRARLVTYERPQAARSPEEAGGLNKLEHAMATVGGSRRISPRRGRPCHNPLKAETRVRIPLEPPPV